MVLYVLGLPETPFNTFMVLTLAGLAIYFGLSGLSYLTFFVWGKKRFHPTYEADPKANKLAMKWGVYGTLGNVALTAPIHILIANNYSQVYWDVSDYGWGWLIASFFIYLAFTETCIYWIHRALHTKVLYRRLHKYHHEWRATTSWASMAFHPLDSFAQALPHHLCVFLFPVHGLLYLTMISFVSVWSVIIHDRVSFVRWNWINYTGHHTLHHWFFRYNYGQFFTVWDKLMGTWRDPEEAATSGKVPEGVLR